MEKKVCSGQKEGKKNYLVRALLSKEQYETFQRNKNLRGFKTNTDFIIEGTIGRGFWVDDKLLEILELLKNSKGEVGKISLSYK